MLIASRREHFSEVGKLAAIAFTGHGVIFLINLILARNLSVDEYENYVVAVAIFLLILAITSQGLDKYAIRMMPAKFARQHHGHAAHYFVFSITRLIIGSIVVAALTLLWATELREYSPDAMKAIHYGLFALPLGALTYYLCAVISATGDCVRAAAVTYLVVPTLTLVCIGVALLTTSQKSGALGILCWLIAWCFGLMLAIYWLKKAWPSRPAARPPEKIDFSWQRDVSPFWFYRLSMGIIAQIVIILLDWLQPSSAATGAYAAALSTAGLAAVLAAATNRVYAREMSIILETGDHAALQRLRIQRLQWMLPALGLFLVIALTFTEEILGLFHPDFVTEGTPAFRILAITTSATVIMGVAPIYLKHQKQNRIIFPALALAALLQALLLLIMVPRLGATGAAVAYMISMLGLYGYFSVASHRQVRAAEAARN
ncbi:lipopolysaccharide biosynthesis protein [Microbulbifer pacificus]|uniref:Membrane protein involved in the export of O-antigen and teichoic acid n=1 Tax=Microbulbifer pacificus TaxID=407164 RepID=A0AAU0MYB9_9GAMM|nr:polysaccharide biosynthesis C-terminal domain-containing protein [Microbulbifer pacificus]WOX05042.1 hypothetical protein R5R33_15035 [Microbulbifer pacificus]